MHIPVFLHVRSSIKDEKEALRPSGINLRTDGIDSVCVQAGNWRQQKSVSDHFIDVPYGG